MRSRIAVLATLLALAPALAPSQTPEQRLFEWTELPFPPEVFEGRRSRLLRELRATGGGLLLVPSRRGVSEGFTFRQLNDFLYLTGLELPDSMLVLDADEKSAILFTPERDARFDDPFRRNDFPGRLLGADPELSPRSGLTDVRAFEDLSTSVSRWARSGRLLRVNAGRAGEIPVVESAFLDGWSASDALLFHLQERYPLARIANAFVAVARARMVHGPEEIEALRRVCDLTVAAIRHAAGFVRHGVTERALEAELEASFKRGGSQRLAFASIIKSGPNSLWPWRILAASYDRRNRALVDGELVIFDVGTELDYYVSDVGRTFPVSGRFTEEQRRALEMSTAVSDAVIGAIRRA